MPTILITGASSGLGKEFARQYLSDGWEVIATCRQLTDTEAFSKEHNPRLKVEKLDVTSTADIDKLRGKLAGQPIDILLNNAAEQGAPAPRCSFGQIDVEAWLELFRINTIAPIKITEAFLPNVRASKLKLLVYMSSRSGSISERGNLPYHRPGGNYHYRTSKAALNAAVRSLGFDLKPEGVGVLALHPGWVRTRGGGPNATLAPEDSVSRLRKVIADFSFSATGTFQDLDGKLISW